LAVTAIVETALVLNGVLLVRQAAGARLTCLVGSGRRGARTGI